MANIIEMPKLSDTMTVGTLVKWLKKEGDAVKSGDMLAEVETDKATMELESFFDGTLIKIFAAEGAQVDIGAPLCAIGKAGEKVDAPGGGKKSEGTGQKTEDSGQKAEGETQKTEDRGPRTEGGEKRSEAKEAPSQDKVSAGADTTSKNEAKADSATEVAPVSDRRHAQAAPSEVPPARAEGERIKISPLARKLAAEKKIDPAHITGTGPGGRIVRADVLAAQDGGGGSPSRPEVKGRGTAEPSAARKAPSIRRDGPVQQERTVPVSNMRGAIARRLLESKTQLPHFYVEIEIDAAPLLALREQLNAGLEAEGVKLSVNDFILKASAGALRQVPAVNASWEVAASGQASIKYHAAAHVSFAVAIEDGLITPVIRDAHLKSIFDISTEAKSLGKLAKDKKLKPDQFTGGTFCVSNLGMMGIPRFSAIINPPNAAILAVGTTVKKPVVKDDQIVIGQVMTLTLSCDHRVVDGAVGAQYLNALKQLLEAPALLLV